MADRRRIQQWLAAGLAVIVAGIVALVIGWALLVPAADWLARHDIGAASGSALVTARNNARGTVLTLSAGILAAGALVFTSRNFVLSRRTLALTEQGQVTDRYTKAIEQLGSDKLDVRIGGIYALERISRDSVRDHGTVMEVLSTFIREHSHEGVSTGDRKYPRADVQAALTVIGRREFGGAPQAINLTGADLAGANLTNVNFTRANLSGADLSGAALTLANLTHAQLYRTDLTGASLIKALLTSAILSKAKLNGAVLAQADLTKAVLADADLSDAILHHAVLAGADLNLARFAGVDLGEVDLTGAKLMFADLEGVTRFPGNPPAGWKRGSDGRLVRDDGPGSLAGPA
jgi:Pentapeptide repeats (8 copies)